MRSTKYMDVVTTQKRKAAQIKKAAAATRDMVQQTVSEVEAALRKKKRDDQNDPKWTGAHDAYLHAQSIFGLFGRQPHTGAHCMHVHSAHTLSSLLSSVRVDHLAGPDRNRQHLPHGPAGGQGARRPPL